MKCRGTQYQDEESGIHVKILIVLLAWAVFGCAGCSSQKAEVEPEQRAIPVAVMPAAGFGALLTLSLFRMDLNIYAFVVIIMLVGLVKKNAIMMIDFALEAQRKEGKAPGEAIHQGCLIRFRPIMMTTMSALMAGLADRSRIRRGRRVSPPAGSGGCRRVAVFTGAHAVHYAGGVCLSGSLQKIRARAFPFTRMNLLLFQNRKRDHAAGNHRHSLSRRLNAAKSFSNFSLILGKRMAALGWTVLTYSTPSSRGACCATTPIKTTISG
jgi:hypothetical protein